MEKIIKIEGMSCGHCKTKVENALNGISGVKSEVNLKKKQALVKFDGSLDDLILLSVISDAGYEPISITEKRGFFSR